ncbi:uncharacterized protein STEHIDRAFT_83759 [Stereum hirsutum FP-91666 SS1]|uniref:uncharacterized protein n=1 Tax=Stereum hirsutum (strain FP-91666) TaxID=721885 RepID=UPI000444A18C|nr:uncharacterized protein STEHIDRAFT_83759 [Stereum hirsutum FP-91666 SS1]EIM83574.1 hypothetical protein STEHIDRAFT_83759 [Stereum hirsutum FP-91666 SS1]
MSSSSVSTPAPSVVDFPTSESPGGPPSAYLQQPRPPYLPFRRISLPTAPSLIHRISVVSTASFDSLPEDGRISPGATLMPPNRSPLKQSKSRPSSVDAKGRAYRKRELRPVNEAKEEKRKKVIEEFYETERTYVDGLDLIYSHFLTPVIASLDTPHPLLSRAELTSVFSNFIDIWNLHRSFFSSLTDHLHASTSNGGVPPPLSPVLLSHFPYLSLYTPFVTSFHTSVASLTGLLTSNAAFSAFVAKQETDPRCGKLKLRDWLLTIVQRCPRYLLLLKDLIGCTDSEDSERVSLMAVHTLVSKITSSLNTSLHTHAQTLALLALQRSAPNLPFQLIVPGRTFLKRGSLLQLENSSHPKEHDFLLFSDCLVWLANLDRSDTDLSERWDWLPGHHHVFGGVGSDAGGGGNVSRLKFGGRPSMSRSRSRSEAELSIIRDRTKSIPGPGPLRSAGPRSPSRHGFSGSPSRPNKRQASSVAADEKWWFKGKLELVDVEVVVAATGLGAEPGEEMRFDVLSPEASFAVYAAGEEERDEWATAIRNAKASLLVSLNVTHPNSTLTSSASTTHLRQTLQALPHLPEEGGTKPKRGKVEHFVPAIWIPDGKTENCMRCAKNFGWRRRRHHCRLCGRLVCASCSGSTFFISDVNGKHPSKSARACDACYETVFPIIDETQQSSTSAPFSLPPNDPAYEVDIDSFPSWQSQYTTPASSRPPSLLMAIDLSPTPVGNKGRLLSPIHDVSGANTPDGEIDLSKGLGADGGQTSDSSGGGMPARPVIKIRAPSSRPRSYHQILEDFQDHDSQTDNADPSPSTATATDDSQSLLTSSNVDLPLQSQDLKDPTQSTPALPTFSSSPSSSAHTHEPTLSQLVSPRSHYIATPGPRREDTARRHKRFSMPAVSLHTTPVTTRPNATGEGRSKRFSLVLGPGRNVNSAVAKSRGPSVVDGDRTVKGNAASRILAEEERERMRGGDTLKNGAAAVKLGELLGRGKDAGEAPC